MDKNFEDYLVEVLASIAASLAEIARNTQRELPDEPDLQRPLEQFVGFDWGSIDATVVKHDPYGVAIVEWGGRLWTRRSPENKFGEAIWFSRANGKDEAGNNRYLRLITFRKVADAEPLSRAAERAVRGAGSSKPEAGSSKPAAPPSAPVAPVAPAAAGATMPSTAPRGPVEAASGVNGHKDASTEWDALEGATERLAKDDAATSSDRHQQPATSDPPVKRSAAVLGAGRVGAEFRLWAKEFAGRHPNYATRATGNPDLYHILHTAGALGYAQITSENMAACCAALEAHAADGK